MPATGDLIYRVPARPPSYFVNRLAPGMKLDPKAIMAVILGEGGNRWGAVGDDGTSFGPVQLHRGGALPAGKGPEFANSVAGLRYAMQAMARSGAAGLTGPDAINAIVRNFERPANPDASVRNAVARYGASPQNRQVGATSLGAASPKGAGGARAELQQALLLALTGPDPEQAFGKLIRGMQLTAQSQSAPRPISSRTGMTPRGASPTGNRVLAAAHAQIGKPYVWGGESPDEGGFDCSGLIDWAYRQAGIDLPGRLTTYSAMQLGKSVKGGQLRPGDMVISNGGKHMTLYVGNGKVIAAPRRGEAVQYQPLSAVGEVLDVRRLI